MLMEQERADKLQKFSRWEAFKIKKDVIIKDYIRAVRKMRQATGFVKHQRVRQVYKKVFGAVAAAKALHKKKMNILWARLRITLSMKSTIKKFYKNRSLRYRHTKYL